MTHLMRSSLNKSLNLCANPHYFSVDKVMFLGTSGQNITDLHNHTMFSDIDIDLLEAT